MTIIEIREKMTESMKNRDALRTEVLKGIINTATILSIAAKEPKDNISDEVVQKAILKEIKTTKDQIETCPKDRIDKLNDYKDRYAILKEYEPKMMTKEEIKIILVPLFLRENISNMGDGMKKAKEILGSNASGKDISEVVKEIMR